MKNITKNKYANFYLNAARDLGLKYSIVNKKIGLVRIFNNEFEMKISSNVLGLNTQLSAGLASNKVKTSTILQDKKIPVPAFRTFVNIKKATDYAIEKLREKKFVVIKPINGSLSIGITVRPSSISQIKEAVAEAFIGNSRIMIEEYISGKHFRITVLDSEVIAITQRVAANVTGDGVSSLNRLIEQKNILRKKNNLPKIFLRKKDLYYLKSERIELSKIYPDGVSITLQLGCDMDIGGERIRIDRDIVPQVNLELFTNAVEALNLRFGGIDYITPDIMTPYTQMVTAINEINSAPDPDVHYRDTDLNDNYSAVRILERLFSQKITVEKENSIPLPFSGLITEILGNSKITQTN